MQLLSASFHGTMGETGGSTKLSLTWTQRLVGPLELFAGRKILSLGVDAFVVVDVVLL